MSLSEKRTAELLDMYLKYNGSGRIIYPANFHKEKAGGYLVTFPDLPGCITWGKTLQEAYLMAGDALLCWISAAGEELPEPSEITKKKNIMYIEPREYKCNDLEVIEDVD